MGDFIRDTVGLSLAERGAYTALLDAYYASERPIPHAERYRLTGAVSKADKAAVDYIVGRYFTEQADGWHQKRADREIAHYRERSASASASAQARWSKGNANAMRTHNEGNANHKPVTSNQESTKPTAAPPPGVRQEVWDEWSRIKGRKLTPYAVRLQAKFLAEQGGDPNAIIEQSIRNGHAGLFPIKGGQPTQLRDKRANAAAAMRLAPQESHEPTDITTEVVRVA